MIISWVSDNILSGNYSSVNVSEHKMRQLKKLLPNQKFACEKNVRKFEAMNEVKYTVTEIPMEFKANANTKSQHKAGDRYLEPKTPVVHANLKELTETALGKLDMYGLLQTQKFTDGKIWIKVFLDADSINTKISINVMNQETANADFKHLLLVYCECPDREFNMSQLMSFLNKELQHFDKMYKHHDIRLWLCGDTKQIWQILGMPTSHGTYPCPFCRILGTEMLQPLSMRGTNYKLLWFNFKTFFIASDTDTI